MIQNHIPLPPLESERLHALQQYQLLDTPSETAFDEITELTARLLNAPIALIVLVDEQRQWFKSRHGIHVTETPREWAFCAHAVSEAKTVVVPDARQDPRFRSNPLVTGEPFMRFYAGAPLLNPEGFAIGTLCVIDRSPRTASTEFLHTLQTLSRQVMAQMELRRVRRDLVRTLHGLQVMQGHLPVCAWCKSVRNSSESWNRVEDYLQHLTGHQITHGICPRCYDQQVAETEPMTQEAGTCNGCVAPETSVHPQSAD
ncbi:MAG: hypothetical protein Fues2KO_21360 [Fuerstiella sp.]